jgi:hypothetical protein
VASAVRAVAGIQAQEPVAGALSIRVRTSGLTRADVDRALVEERSVVRLWAMRGTIHLVASEDAAWLVDLLGPIGLTGARRRLVQLGVPEADQTLAVRLVQEVLAEHGPLSRVELAGHLARAGITTEGQAAAHLPALAAIQGLVCFGPPRGGKPTYVLRDDWLGSGLPRMPREQAVRELALRYVRAFGPAEPRDFAIWSGLPLRDARAGWEAVGKPRTAVPARAGVTRLLPAFDTYLLGYRSRDFCVATEHARKVWPGGGIVRPTVVVDGRAVGTWRRSGVKVELGPFPGEELDATAEVADVQRFLDRR